MVVILITLKAFFCGEMTYFHDGEWSRWEKMSPLLRGMRGSGSWVDTGSQELFWDPFPGFWGKVSGHDMVPRPDVSKTDSGRGMNMSSQHTGLCPIGLHLC